MNDNRTKLLPENDVGGSPPGTMQLYGLSGVEPAYSRWSRRVAVYRKRHAQVPLYETRLSEVVACRNCNDDARRTSLD